MPLFLTPIRHSVQIPALQTTVAFSIKIPGTFTSLIPNDAATGRYLKAANIRADVPTGAEYVKDLKVTDTDGVIPSGERALLPAYPDMIRFYDASDTANLNGSWLPATFEPFDLQGNKQIRALPSGLYITGTIGGAELQVFRIDITWGRYINTSL